MLDDDLPTGPQSMTVLIVSHRALLRLAVQAVLSSMYIRATECTDVVSGAVLATERQPAIILIDLDTTLGTEPLAFAAWCNRLPYGPHIIALDGVSGHARSWSSPPRNCTILGADVSPATLASAVTHAFGSDSKASISQPVLTMRQREVLAMAATGRTNEEIGRTLVIATGTVKRHLYDSFALLQARSRVDAVNRARVLGFI